MNFDPRGRRRHPPDGRRHRPREAARHSGPRRRGRPGTNGPPRRGRSGRRKGNSCSPWLRGGRGDGSRRAPGEALTSHRGRTASRAGKTSRARRAAGPPEPAAPPERAVRGPAALVAVLVIIGLALTAGLAGPPATAAGEAARGFSLPALMNRRSADLAQRLRRPAADPELLRVMEPVLRGPDEAAGLVLPAPSRPGHGRDRLPGQPGRGPAHAARLASRLPGRGRPGRVRRGPVRCARRPDHVLPQRPAPDHLDEPWATCTGPGSSSSSRPWTPAPAPDGGPAADGRRRAGGSRRGHRPPTGR